MTLLFAAMSCEKAADSIKNNPKEVIVTGSATDIGLMSAKLYGWCNKNGEPGVSIPFGIEYSDTDLTTDGIMMQATDKDSDNKYCCEAVDLNINTLYYYRAWAFINGALQYGEVKSFKTSGLANGAVDMGLSVKWAGCNLGATKPEEYGDYYAWGETAPYYSSQDPLTWKDGKTGYNWASYSLCNGNDNTLTKYNNSSSVGTVDNKTEFKDYNYKDDAARQVLGAKWRMPTDGEWTELRENCTWKWFTVNSVNGMLVISNKNGNSIFLPAAGRRSGTDLYSAGSTGFYWSSSLYTDYPHWAWRVYFYSGYVDRSDYYRCSGFSVRPVSEQ